MKSPLFRPQAQARPRRLEGQVIFRQPVRYRVVVAIVLALIVGLCLLITFGTYAKRMSASGYVVTNLGLVTIRPPTGVLLELNVREGAKVEKGARVAVIDRSLATGRDAGFEEIARRELLALDASLLRQAERERELSRNESDLVLEELTVQDREQKAVEARLMRAHTKLKLAERRFTAARDLHERKYISEFALLDHEDALLEAQSAIDELNSALKRAQYLRRELALRIDDISLKLATRLQEVERQQSELRQRTLELQAHSEMVVLAPIGGVVSAIRGHVGDALDGQSPLLTILPTDAKLEIELYLTSAAVTMVRDGSDIILRYPAFPHQKYGLQRGVVSEISNAMMSPIDAPDGLHLPNEPLFRVRVRPSTVAFHIAGMNASLQPGMLAEADVLGERRALWQWMLTPLSKIKT